MFLGMVTNTAITTTNTSPILHQSMKLSKFFAFFLALAFCLPANAQTDNDCNEADFQTLVTIYLKTEGWNWTEKWDLNQPVSTWKGVTLNQEGCVTGLSLKNNNLSGEFPDVICDLTNLTSLDLSSNKLSGTLPECVGSLTKLVQLDLSVNQLSGSLPFSIGQLTNLRTLSLYQNQLNGFLPSSIGNLTKLFTLNLQGNAFFGSIPATIGNLEKLFVLSLENNQFSGSIPDEIGDLKKVFYMDLGHNNLSGSIPTSISQMSSLFNLELNDNQLSGEIPAAIMGLSKLQSLWLSNNRLSGSIPEDLIALKNLEWLALNDNQLEGSIPESLEDLEKLSLLYLENNALSGTLPEAISTLTRLTEINVSNNNLSGCFPASYKSICNIKVDFSANQNLPNGGDFDAFCASDSGQCGTAESEECMVFSVEGANADCYATRRIAIAIERGTAPFTISLSGPITGSARTYSRTFAIQGVPSGKYIVTLTDQNGCSATTELTIASSCQFDSEPVSSSRSKTTFTSLTLADFELTGSVLSVAKNYPNPFTKNTTLPFTLTQTGEVSIIISTATGQQVYQLIDVFDAGQQEVQLDGSIFKETGMYIYQVQSGEQVQSGKMMKL